MFSPASGETHLLNNAAAALLELLEDGPLSVTELQRRLASDMGLPPDELGQLAEETTEQLRYAGLLQRSSP